MAITRVKGTTVTATNVSSATATVASVSAGNTLVAAIYFPTEVSIPSVTDNQGNPWIKAASTYSFSASVGNVELWYSRGVKGVPAGNTTVTFPLTGNLSSTSYIVLDELAGAYYVDPLDCWAQTDASVSAASVGNTRVSSASVDPRDVGEFIVSALLAESTVSFPAIVGASVSGAVSLTTTGSNASVGTYDGLKGSALFGYGTLSASTAATPIWNLTSASTNTIYYVGVNAILRPGTTGLNPCLQFPETLVQISPTINYSSVLTNDGYWVNISNYVLSMRIGPFGRQHELDRIESTAAHITVDGRDGTFNPWNTNSFLYYNAPVSASVNPQTATQSLNGGLRPMNPVQVTAAWNGVTYPKFWGYVQAITPTFQDVLDVDFQIVCYDIFQLHSLKYLSSQLYAALVEADGGSNLNLFYQLNNSPGDNNVTDSSGSGLGGSLIAGPYGNPTFGQSGPFLYDSSTSVDLTAGSKTPNGGISTTYFLTSPPTEATPLSSTTQWTFECWYGWNSSSVPAASTLQSVPTSTLPVQSVPNAVLMHATSANAGDFEIQLGSFFYNKTISGFPYAIVVCYNNCIFVGNADTGYSASQIPNNYNPYDGTFHHVVVNVNKVASSNTGASVWFDGYKCTEIAKLSASVSAASVAPASVSAISFGSPPNGTLGFYPWDVYPGLPAEPAPVLLANVALYADMNLTQAQISSHFNLGVWFQNPEIGAATGNAQQARLNKIITILGLDPSTTLKVPYAFKTVLYPEIQNLSTGSGLNYTQSMSGSEPGIIFQGPDGFIYAYNRQYQYLNTTSNTSQAAFADTAVASYHYSGEELKITSDDLNVWNDIQVQSGKTGALMQETNAFNNALASVSSQAYGTRTLQGQTSLLQYYDYDALATAQNYLAWYWKAQIRVESLKVKAQANQGNNIPQMLGRGLMDQITVDYTGQTPGTTFTQDSVIESIEDYVDLSGPTWETTWQLSPYEILLYPTILGTFTFGVTSGSYYGSVGYGQLTL